MLVFRLTGFPALALFATPFPMYLPARRPRCRAGPPVAGKAAPHGARLRPAGLWPEGSVQSRTSVITVIAPLTSVISVNTLWNFGHRDLVTVIWSP